MQDQSEGWQREVPPPVDSKAVLEQLDRMLKSRHFRNSRRYPAFLAHVVRRTLERDFDSLKERILGIDVFKRAHDYDTSADPVVRITAGEVRKRIALYYHDEGTEQELRIELPAGSYIPTFSPTASTDIVSAIPAAPPEFPVAAIPERTFVLDPASAPATLEQRWSRHWLVRAILVLVIALAAAGGWYWSWVTSPLESMWRPFLRSPAEVLVVIGSPLGTLAGPAEENSANAKPLDSHSHVHVAFTDALALADIIGLLQSHGQAYRAQTSMATSLDDLRKRPVILITAFSNPWTGRILAPLRFSLLRQQIAPDGTTVIGSIVDHRRAGTLWSFDFTKPVTVNNRDYAVVARIQSDLTEGPVMVVAGLGPSATESAGEFVASGEYLKQISAQTQGGWRERNLELVLEVPVIDGKAGHAHIVASDFW